MKLLKEFFLVTMCDFVFNVFLFSLQKVYIEELSSFRVYVVFYVSKMYTVHDTKLLLHLKTQETFLKLRS